MGTEDNSLLLNQKNKLLFRLFLETFSREPFLKGMKRALPKGAPSYRLLVERQSQ